MTKIEIKNRYNGEVIFYHECEYNSIAVTVKEAVKNNVSLRYADLRNADLCDADLSYSDLSNANLRNAYMRSANLSNAYMRSANLSSAYLRNAYLSNADLSSAYLRNAYLSYADLRNADLREADLSNAYLSDAYLSDADLSFADLSYADLSNADLRNADLRDADLRSADLRYANLSSAKNVPHVHMECPTDGPFIGWKKVKGYLIELEIPADAQRSSATTNKCRCDKAYVVSITNIKNGKSIDKIDNNEYAHTEYMVGQMVFPDGWDDNRFNECSHGIHFFIDKQDAIDY